MTLICVTCKRPFVLPSAADKRRPYVCDACYAAMLREAAERIKIKVKS